MSPAPADHITRKPFSETQREGRDWQPLSFTHSKEGVMPLRETAQTIPAKKPGFQCGVEKLKSKLDADDRAWLQEQLEDSEKSHQWIADVLTADGKEISQGVVSRHRAGRCRCGSL